MSGEELRALAEAATPGPWSPAKWDPTLLLTDRWAREEQDPDGRGPWMAVQASELADAAFIAAANPTAVLAILDERDALRAQVERVRALADEWEAAAQKPMPRRVDGESQQDQGVRIGVWHSVQRAATELRAALEDEAARLVVAEEGA